MFPPPRRASNAAFLWVPDDLTGCHALLRQRSRQASSSNRIKNGPFVILLQPLRGTAPAIEPSTAVLSVVLPGRGSPVSHAVS